MSYVQQSLGPDEELVHMGQFHWMYTLKAIFSIILGTIAAIGLLVAAVIGSRQFGWLPEDIGWLDSLRGLHVGIRIGAFLLFILGLLSFSHQMITKLTTEIAVTTSRLVYKRGLVARSVGEISIDRIESVNVYQTIMGRIFNYGWILVRGMGVGEIVLPIINDPISFRKAIDRARSL